MCSAPVDPGGEVRSCCVGCILGTPEISPFVFIVAASRYMVFLAKEMFFQAGGFWVRRNFVFFCRYVSFRVACGFTLMKVVFPGAGRLDGQEKRCRGITI